MRTIFADFNAMTPEAEVRLNSPGSQDDLRRTGIGPGDWAWLSDDEILVGGRLRDDPYWGLLGSPDWDTRVSLDAEGADDFQRVATEWTALLQKRDRTEAEEWRVFQLLTILERCAPPLFLQARRPGYYPFRRAGVLLLLRRPELARLEIEEARRVDPGHENYDVLYLEILRRIDLDRALEEAKEMAEANQAPAQLIAAYVNILSTRADQLTDEQFPPLGTTIIEWAQRFEQAPGRDNVPDSTLGQLDYNLAQSYKRLGRMDEADESLQRACHASPLLARLLRSNNLPSEQVSEAVRSLTLAA
jgi:tetratricopeptide (TPR) repeat protein